MVGLMTHYLTYPFTAAKVRKLAIGDRVLVSGRIVTGRDSLHEHLFHGGSVPVDLKSSAIYHCGPVVVRENMKWSVRAAGPTTSMRAERFMPRIIERHKIRLIIGKGGMGANTLAACARHGCAYLYAVGGAAQILAERIERVAGVHFLNEFGSAEAMWMLDVTDFPAIVTMDAHGKSLHQLVAEKSLRFLIRNSIKPKLPARR
jgi:tartrate/fumarate subfamily iron-sulfur-dependent hydro-lyase beta chain